MNLKISKRLICAAEMAGTAKILADIGTDHAYLPIHMLLHKRIENAIVTDINSGPLERAKKNAVLYGISDKIKPILTDGLKGVERFSPDVIVIAGMGGELIARIISEADFLKDEKSRLVLQPMTKPEILRKELIKNGFSISEEKLVSDGKLYVLISAQFNGQPDPYTEAELLVGKKEHFSYDPLFEEHVFGILKRTVSSLNGISCSAQAEKHTETIKKQEEIICELYRMLSDSKACERFTEEIKKHKDDNTFRTL